MFTHKKVVNTYIVYEMNLWPFTVGKDFMIENSIFRAVKLTTNNDNLENINILAKVMDFMHVEVFLLSNGSGPGNIWCYSVHTDNKKEILILGKSPKNGLDDTWLTAEKEYAITFTEQQKKFCLVCIIMG